MIVRHLALLVFALLVAGCSTTQTEQQGPQEVNLAGYPPNFRDGYAEGCDSARHPDKPKRDEARYKSDSMYAAGWRDGFDICSGKTYE